MFKFEVGVMDRTRLVSNVLMILLLCGNIFFSIQYAYNLAMERERASAVDAETTRIQVSRFLKLFIDKVLNTEGTITFDDRVKLESDVREIGDPAITKQWEAFVSSTGTDAQQNAVKLMSMLTNKML